MVSVEQGRPSIDNEVELMLSGEVVRLQAENQRKLVIIRQLESDRVRRIERQCLLENELSERNAEIERLRQRIDALMEER